MESSLLPTMYIRPRFRPARGPGRPPPDKYTGRSLFLQENNALFFFISFSGEKKRKTQPKKEGKRTEKTESEEPKRAITEAEITGETQNSLTGRKKGWTKGKSFDIMSVAGCADVAQLVEQPIRNQQVRGSSPLIGSSNEV